MNLRMINANNLPYQLLLTERRLTADIKLSKAQITTKIIQSGGFSGSLLSKLAGPLVKVAVPLAKNILAP